MRLRELKCRLKRNVKAGIGCKGFGMAVSIALTGMAVVILCIMVRDIGIGKVIAAAMAIPARALVAACCFACVGYCMLMFYDYVALRALGRHDVPYATAGLAGFAAYAIGHGLGLTLLTANAVRLRIYSRWGMSVVEVAKISFITGLIFWLGNICALGFALVIAPGTAAPVTHLPVWVNQALGLTMLTAISAYIAWLVPAPRAVGAASWRLVLPDAPLTMWLIGIGLLDLAAGSLATYVLLPPTPPTDYAEIAVAYVIATLMGFLSHAPGSLGVFEVAMLVMLSQYQKEELLASLLIVHVLYYVLPLALALVLFGVRETRLAPAGSATGR